MKWVYIANVIAIVIYNLVGWAYIFKYLNTGGASLGPGFLLILGTGLHIIVLFLIALIKMVVEVVKERRTTVIK
jgi:hypothetical protein